MGNFMGIMIGSAVVPVACCIYWDKTSAFAAITSAWVGNIAAVITWLVTAASLYDEVSKETTGKLYAQLAGNCVALGLSFILCVSLSLLFPQNYDFSEMNGKIKLMDEAKVLGEDWE